jgi:hypothetical protein
MSSDNDFEVTLGKVLQSIEDLKADVKELKAKQSEVNTYIIGLKFLGTVVLGLGSAYIYFKEHVESIIFGKVPH